MADEVGMNLYFGELENRIRDACNEYPPDLEEIARLMEQCGDLSIASPEDPEETMLSDVILWYPEQRQLKEFCRQCTDDSCEGCGIAYEFDGRWLPGIVSLFLRYGFDVRRNNGMAGRVCLGNLMLSLGDAYAIEAEKLLLAAGADPLIKIGGENVIQQYGAEASFRYGEGEPWHESLYNTMEKVARAASQGRDFQGIEFFECCIGKRIDRIEMACAGAAPSPPVGRRGSFFAGCRNCFSEPIIFHCGGKPLCIDRWLNIWVDPNVGQQAQTVIDISRFFPGCVGRRITAVEFPHGGERRGKNRFFLCLRLDDGRAVSFFIRRLKEARVTGFVAERPSPFSNHIE